MWIPSCVLLLALLPSCDGLFFGFLGNIISNIFGGRGEFEMTIDYQNVPAIDRFFFFRRAQRRWQRIITGDVPDVNDNRLANFSSTDCGLNPTSVDDIYICVSYKIIDGPGGVVGAGFASLYRGSYIPITGSIEFEAEDVPTLKDNDLFQSSILSEMASVLGLNQFAWESKDLITAPNATPACAYGVATNAGREWRSVSGCTNSVPVEASFPSQPNIQCGHWDQECMLNEILTPTVQSDAAISRVTIGALEDLGYVVDYNRADDYASSDLNSTCSCGRRRDYVRKLSSTSRRELSAGAFQAALDYGRNLIQRLKPEQMPSTTIETDITAGNTAVVLVYEDNELYSVVTSL